MKFRSITARLDETSNHQLEFIKNILGYKHTTDVLVEAIQTLFTSVQKQQAEKSPFDIFEELGLIGCLEGEKTSSQTYKEEIYAYLQHKHAIHNRKPTRRYCFNRSKTFQRLSLEKS